MSTSRSAVLVVSLVLLGLVIIGLILAIPSNLLHRHEQHMEPVRFPDEPTLHTLSDTELDHLLARLASDFPSLEDRLRILALRRIGTPYRRDCLGEGAGRDPDPLFRVDSTDCTVFILTQAAMGHASSLTEARQNMAQANYREVNGDRPTRYENRLHFTVDRLRASPYFREITARVAGDAPVKEANVLLNRMADGTRLLAIPWEKPVTATYVPAGELTEDLLGRLPCVAGVGLVRETYFDLGLVTAHEGMLLDGHDFVHGSSERGCVIRQPFFPYLFPEGGGPLFDGVIFYEFR